MTLLQWVMLALAAATFYLVLRIALGLQQVKDAAARFGIGA